DREASIGWRFHQPRERPFRSRAAVVGEHHIARFGEIPRGHEYGSGTGPHDALDLRADVIGREFVARTPLADNDHMRTGFSLEDRLDNAAVTVNGAYIDCAAIAKALLARSEEGASALDLDLGGSRFEFDQFLHEARLDAEPDRSGQVTARSDGIGALDYVQQLHGHLQAPGGPGGIAADAVCVARGADTGEDVFHVLPPSMPPDLRVGARLVVHGEALHHRGAGPVEADHLHIGAFAAELEDRLVERPDRRD